MAYLPPPGVPTAGMVAPGAPPYPPNGATQPMPPGVIGPSPLAAPYSLAYPAGVPSTPYHAPPTAIGFQPLFPAYQQTGGPPLNSLPPMAPHAAPPPMNNNAWGYSDPSKANPYQMTPVITQQPQPGWTQNSRYHKYDSDSDGDYVVDANGQRVKRQKKKKKGCCGGGCCCDPSTLCCAFCIWFSCCPKDFSCFSCFDCGDCFDCDSCGDCADCGDCDGCDREMD